MRGGRCENIAPVKSFAYRMIKEIIIRDFKNAKIFRFVENKTQQTIIRCDKKIIFRFNQNRPSFRTDTGINNRDENRFFRKIFITGAKRKTRGSDILRLDLVRDVNNFRVFIDLTKSRLSSRRQNNLLFRNRLKVRYSLTKNSLQIPAKSKGEKNFAGF